MHAFFRDPSIGLFGPIAAMGGALGSRIGLYGAEGEFYMGPVTLSGSAGYQDAVNNGALTILSGAFYTGRLTVYPTPDLALAVEGRSVATKLTGRGTVEYQPDFLPVHNMSFYVDAEAGDDSYEVGFPGGLVRFRLGT